MEKALILDNAIAKIGNNQKMYKYDYNLDMNIIIVGKSIKPFIDMDINITDLETNTRIERERDDEEISMLELETKSFEERERDDEDNFTYNK